MQVQLLVVPKCMSSVIEEIKSRLNIVDVAEGYLKLEGAGGNFKARCPFHNEQTPSFFISPSRQTYHCFGCNRGGDLISFVEEIEGLDFSGALKILAERAGIELTRQHGGISKETKDEREMLYRTLDLATKFYEAVLPKFPEAQSYLKNRGLSDETIKHFRVGFAPDEWRALGDFLTKKGVPEGAMEKAGLIVRGDKGFYDRFRGRLMFPIRDSSGRVVAFSGRILKESAGKTLGASAAAKYVNSPETEVFHKSRILFGFYEAKDALRRLDSVVLVEGQMDLILSHQSGVINAVASSGTALTGDHLTLIKRFTKNLVLAFDADDAGLTAAYRAIGLALSQDMSVRIAALPRGMDPADLALKDQKAWQGAVKDAKQVVDFYLELLPSLYADKAELRKKVSQVIVPFIAELRSAIDQGHYVGQTAKLLGIKDDPVWDEVKKIRAPETSGATPKGHTEHDSAGQNVLARHTRITGIIQGILLWQEAEKEPRVKNIASYRARLAKILEAEHPPGLAAAPLGATGKESELIFEAETRFGETPHLEEEIKTLFKSLEDEILRDSLAKKWAELKNAEARGDADGAQKLLAEYQEFSHKLHQK
jgi:DNA primase